MCRGNNQYKNIIIEYFNNKSEGNINDIFQFIKNKTYNSGYNKNKKRTRLPSTKQISHLIKGLGGVVNNGQWILDIDKAMTRIP